MKKIGLIGGTGPESTLVYYKEINRRVNEKCGNKAFPEIVIDSVDLIKTLGLVNNERLDELTEDFGVRLQNLEKSGAEIVALTAATMHIIYERLKPYVKVPFISIPETVAEYAVSRGYKKVGLLGTIVTMEKDYLKRAFVEKGIEVAVPSKNDRELVNSRIINELEYGVIKPESVAELTGVIEKMKKEQRIEAVILGCTELPLALNEKNCPVEPLDIVDIHIDRLVEMICQ